MDILEFKNFLGPKNQKSVLNAFRRLDRDDLFWVHRKRDPKLKFSYRYKGFPLFPLDKIEQKACCELLASKSMKGFPFFLKALERIIREHRGVLCTKGGHRHFDIVAVSATQFENDHFLSPHTDGVANDLAFCYYPALQWKTKSGGDLVFLNSGQEEFRCSPVGDRLFLFRVPRLHRVDKVIGKDKRWAITGWVRFRK
jgi:Rps23 Pro-64 3,4-dihydroxylase Tpa1-like proline 4-hydroxylase